MISLLNLIVGILKTPSILVGLIALVGLVLQGKPLTDVIKGTIKTIMGFLILGAGADLIVASLSPMGKIFEQAFHITGVVPNNEAIIAVALKDFGTPTALIMALGMVANILIARFTRLKYIFLTGHHTLYMACMIAVMLTIAGFSGSMLVIVGSVLLGLTMAVFPALAQPFMKGITGDDSVAFGHFSTLGYILSGYIGKAVGKGSKSTEEMELPKNLSFLRDSSISISLTMMVIYLVLAIAAGNEFVSTLSDGQNYIVFVLIKAIAFAGGVFVVLQGVRLILNEIVPAFTGISEKLVPNAKPALDCPIVFPYAPNAVLIGFLFSFLGGIVGLALLWVFKGVLALPLILPGVVPHFFCGATAGVFGNSTGGRKGAMIGAFANGLLLTALPAVLFPLLATLGFAGSTFSDADFATLGIILGGASKVLSPTVITCIIFAIVILLVGHNFIAKKED